MFRNKLRPGSGSLAPCNENAPDSQPDAHLPSDELPQAANVRALATGAALAVSVDTSPAVLVSIYQYAHRYRDKGRRSA